MKKLVIDARMVGKKVHGVARYVQHLALGLSRIEGELSYRVVFLIHPEGQAYTWHGFETVVTKSSYLHPAEMVELPLKLRALGADLYHSPSFSSLPYCPCPWVITIHDLNHLIFGSSVKKIYYQNVLRPFARKAKTVVTVSEFSRKEVSLWLGLGEDQIPIVYNSIDPPLSNERLKELTPRVLSRFGLEPKKYFFNLSNTKPHKNLTLLVDAFKEFRKRLKQGAKGSDWPLVLTIPNEMPGLTPEDGCKFTGPLGHDEAQVLLTNASALVFPSLYEGFGRPPVEAAILGVPILVSKIPPHEEALQDVRTGKADFISPRDFASWVKGFQRLVDGEILGAAPDARKRILERYDVTKMGQKMDRIYRSVLDL